MKQILLRVSLLCAVLVGAAACDDPTGAGPPSSVTVAAGGDQAAPAGNVLAQPVVVQVTDDDGDPVQGVEVRFAVISGGGLVDPGVDSTDAQGQASTAWRLGTATADSQQVRVQVIDRNGSVAATTVVRATAQPLAARNLSIAGGNGQSGAVNTRLADSLTVRVVDELGNGVPGVAVAWTVSPNGGTVSPATSTTRADGTAKTAWTLGGVSGGHTATATAAGVQQPATFGATATSAFTFTVTRPLGGRAYGDSLPIQVTATTSSGTIVRMTARVEDRSLNLSAGQGTLNLAGLSEGQKSLLIWAVTAAGDSAAVQVRFILNRAPVLTVTAPVRGTVVRTGSVRIDADCSDPSGCTRVAVYATQFPDGLGEKTLLAEGTTSFHGDVPLGEYNGRRIALFVEATDGLGGTSRTVLWPIFVENTAAWQEVASAGFRALDVDATRILYVDSVAGTERVMVRALAGGTPTELLQATPGDEVKLGRLFAGGAIFSTRDRIYESRGGAPATQLAFTDHLGYLLRVEGDFAVWSAGGTLWRRRLSTGATNVVNTDMLTGNHDVAANGDVVFTGSDFQVYRWRNGTTTHVSNGLRGTSPRTGGTQVIWTADGAIYLWRGGTPEWLTSVSPGPYPPEFYEVNGGWAAYVKPSASGQGQVFSIAPDGTVRQVSPSTGEARLAAVGPDGAIVYIQPFGALAPRRWLSEPPYTARTDVGGYFPEEVRFIGDDPYFFVGRSAFRVNR